MKAILPSSGKKRSRKSSYRSVRAVRPPTHVVTQWTYIKLIILLVGGILLGILMILPLWLLPDSHSNVRTGDVGSSSSSSSSSKHGLSSLLHKSSEIRQNWKRFVEREKSLFQEELEKDKKYIQHELEKDLPALFHPHQEQREPPQETPPTAKEEQPYLGRGVSGLPMQLTPALKGAQKGHIECDEDVDDLVYWNDPQGFRDKQFHSPFSVDKPLYLTFEPDMGGWNNVRMSLETILVFAAATGRTLVLPPKAPFYLLAMGKEGARTFAHFYNLHNLKQRVSIISMEEFFKDHAQDVLGITNATLVEELKPFASMCLHQQSEPSTNCDNLWRHFRSVGWQPPFKPIKECLVFDERVFETSDTDRIPEDVQQHIHRFCDKGRDGNRPVIYYNQSWTEHQLMHWKSGSADDYRLLNHFYTTFYFTNPSIDNYFKRLVRDFLRYKDDLYCAAGKIVHALNAEFGTWSSWHVRRGDFQYKSTRLSIEEWYNNTKDVLKPNEPIYIATDERNKTFFDPLQSKWGHKIHFLDDFDGMVHLNHMDPTYLGMMDTIVAASGRTFTGTWFSTYSGYINRLRGYQGMSMKNSWYSWLERKDRMQKWEYPNGNHPAREWPIAWTGIDGDEWVEEEQKAESDEFEMEVEARLIEEEPDEEVEPEEEEIDHEPIERKIPSMSLSDLAHDTDFGPKPVARGVSGRPLSETPAVAGAKRAHVECDINIDSLAYWNDPQSQRDIDFRSPFAVKEGSEKYITFGIDRGGWNNVRMSMEIIFIIALVTRRTLVLPPEIKLYLLHHDQEKKTRSFADFFPLHTKEFAKRIKIISMPEFIEKEGGTNGRVPLPDNDNKAVIQKAADHCEQRAKSDRSCMTINGFLEESGYFPQFRAIDGCVVFDVNKFNGKEMDAAAKESVTTFCGSRVITYWNQEQNEPTLVHFHADDKVYRLLTHFYSMLHFTDPAIDHYVKRFVRDFLHYHDSIFCAAGKIVKALQYEGKQRGHAVDDEGGGGYSAMHIRRGDLQYKKVKISAKTWWNNTQELWKENEIIYIATDERNKTWFNPIARKRDIRFLDDYWDFAQLGKLDPNYMGMIDTIVASRGRVFAGTWFSTFSGYINRMRGYHGMSMMDSWYSFLPRKTAVHKWENVDHYAYAYEWPTGWVGIDAEVQPSKDVF